MAFLSYCKYTGIFLQTQLIEFYSIVLVELQYKMKSQDRNMDYVLLMSASGEVSARHCVFLPRKLTRGIYLHVLSCLV